MTTATTAKTEATKTEEWIPKVKAAQLLKVNERQIEKRAQEGWIRKRYQERKPTERSARVEYLLEDVKALVAGKPNRWGEPVAMEPAPGTGIALVPKDAGMQKAFEQFFKSGPPITAEGLAAMQLTPQAQLAALNAQTALCEAQIAALKIPTPRREWPAWLTFDEAVQYSGLTPAMLENVIRDGSVASLGRGRGTWRISRVTLDEHAKGGL